MYDIDVTIDVGHEKPRNSKPQKCPLNWHNILIQEPKVYLLISARLVLNLRPRDSCTAAVALVADRLQDHLQTMSYNAPRAY